MSIAFKPLTLEDKPVLDSYYAKVSYRNCDYSFANTFLWNNLYPVRWGVTDGMLVQLYAVEKPTFFFPVGDGDLKAALEAMMAYSEEQGFPFRMSLSREMEAQLERVMPGVFAIEYERDFADYVYRSEDLITLKGKKYHGKRNHINSFKEQYDWSYEPITDDNTMDCIRMLARWCKENDCTIDDEAGEEACVVRKALMYRTELGLVGGLIRLHGEPEDGEVVAFTLGEPVCADTFVVHFEKAFSHVNGAYPIINQQFIEHVASGYAYINREEDVGVEGLRRAKLSYKPVFLVEKGVATVKAPTVCCTAVGTAAPCGVDA